MQIRQIKVNCSSYLSCYISLNTNSATGGGAIHVDENSQIHLYNDTIATLSSIIMLTEEELFMRMIMKM